MPCGNLQAWCVHKLSLADTHTHALRDTQGGRRHTHEEPFVTARCSFAVVFIDYTKYNLYNWGHALSYLGGHVALTLTTLPLNASDRTRG